MVSEALDRHPIVLAYRYATAVFSSRKLERGTYGDDLAISTRCRFIAVVMQGRMQAAPLVLFRAGGAEDVGGGAALTWGDSCPTSRPQFE
jgi:hypothetical protein